LRAFTPSEEVAVTRRIPGDAARFPIASGGYVRPVAHLADGDDAIAFAAFHTLVAPALRAAARWPLRRARHTGSPCRAPAGTGACADCEATLDDLQLDAFARLRTALAGPLPTTL
jgi:hypothetical protein